MIANRIKNATRYLGAPAGWQPDKQGHCAHLAIWDIETTAGPAMMSSWEPTPDELARINAGAPVELLIVGTVHPPVEVRVGYPPREEA